MSQLPTGTVTFLFTDIEGSTRLVQTLGDAYEDLLAKRFGARAVVVGRNFRFGHKRAGDFDTLVELDELPPPAKEPGGRQPVLRMGQDFPPAPHVTTRCRRCPSLRRRGGPRPPVRA